MQRFYMDVNAGIGRMNHKEIGIPYTTESLLNDMKYFKIHASLVYSNLARDYSFVKGNKQLIEEIKTNHRLFGAAVIIPEVRYEIEEGPRYLDMLVDNGIKAFKMYPVLNGHGFDPFSLENIAEFMIKKNIPLIVDLNEVNFAR